MAIRPIDGNELYRIEKLLDTDIVRQDKVALNLLEQVLYDIQHVPTLTPPNEPLTLEQLREMDGQPVWCEDVERWAIVSVSDAGKWKGIPFALFEENGARFEWNIEGRELSLSPYPPAHIDRSKWEFCLWCKDLQYLPHEMCADVKMPGGSEIGASFCPHCGRPLTEEAWAELERRLRG